MGKFKDHFVHKLIVADGPRDGNHFRVRRHLGDEPLGIKLPQLLSAHTSGHHRNVVHVGIWHHGGEGVFDVMGGELVAHMLLPELAQKLLSSREVRF